jgi:hypothetical protein
MAIAFAVLLVVHGLIHLLGAAKAFGRADLPQLTQPISPAAGALWLVSAGLFLATAALLFQWPRGWWLIGALSCVCGSVMTALAQGLPAPPRELPRESVAAHSRKRPAGQRPRHQTAVTGHKSGAPAIGAAGVRRLGARASHSTSA